MEGIFLSVNREEKWGRVSTRNDEIGTITIYFQAMTDDIQPNCTVEFELKTSRTRNRYAKFIRVADRNQTQQNFNTEDRSHWYAWGEDVEGDFIAQVVPRLGIDLRINPEKAQSPWAIDLYDYTHQRYADLKEQSTPFFTAGKYRYGNRPYDPAVTVTFNKKDYERYKKEHPDCDIYFWVNWKQLVYRDYQVRPLHGIWRAPFAKMAQKIERGEVALHAYQHRKNDDHNAKESYLFTLTDTAVFEQLL